MGAKPSEREIIRRIQERLPAGGGDLVKGIGDDCAVLRQAGGRLQVFTTDTLVEGVHFDRSWHPPELLGSKAAAVNLSDIAAMGAEPRFALLSLGVPAAFAPDWLAGFIAGFLDTLGRYEVMLIGGDTVQSGHEVMVSVTVGGDVAEDRVLYRSGAREGDLVWVSGPLGEAAAGLEICRRRLAETEPAWRQLVRAHLDPAPETALGPLLAASGLVHAMMDLSDGLATDLAHLCEASGVAAELVAEQLPLSSALRGAAVRLGATALDWALRGGEDYRLLFTAPAGATLALEELAAARLDRELHCVGRIVAGSGVTLCDGSERRDISYQGYDHFAP